MKACGSPQSKGANEKQNEESGGQSLFSPIAHRAIREKLRTRVCGNGWLARRHHTFASKRKVALIDPWVMTNPVCPDSLKKVPKLDAIFLTHGHSDHLGDLLALAKQHRPQIVAIYEACAWIESNGCSASARR